MLFGLLRRLSALRLPLRLHSTPPADFSAAFSSPYHAPVLCQEVCEWLVTDPGGVYIDGTLGGGGHSAALLFMLSKAADAAALKPKVLGIDRDREAIATASERLQTYGESGMFEAVQRDFARMADVVDKHSVSGILLDLGVSSRQIDDPGRGFSFAEERDGPLDMRMDATAGRRSAADLVNYASADELVRILREYGEQPSARRIVTAILKNRPIERTWQLAQVVERCVPFKERQKASARVFQALRIAVNDELGQLEQALLAAEKLLRPGGR